MKSLLSEALASCVPVHSGAGKAKARCSVIHPAIRRNYDEWRDVPLEDQISTSCKGDLPDVIPIATDGIRFIAFVTNLIEPERVLNAVRPKAPRAERPAKQSTVTINLDDLFDSE